MTEKRMLFRETSLAWRDLWWSEEFVMVLTTLCNGLPKLTITTFLRAILAIVCALRTVENTPLSTWILFPFLADDVPFREENGSTATKR